MEQFQSNIIKKSASVSYIAPDIEVVKVDFATPLLQDASAIDGM